MSKNRKGKGVNSSSKSEQSYNLLCESGTGMLDFSSVTMINCPTLQNVSPLTSSPSQLSPMSNPEFLVALKKISSKDDTTITKGLQSFEELIDKELPQTCVLYAAEWSDHYEKLLYNRDTFIRKRAHQLMGLYGAKVKKGISPYLDLVLPHLFLGMSDPQQRIQEDAIKSYQMIFTTDRAKETIYQKYTKSLLKYYNKILTNINNYDKNITDRLLQSIYTSLSFLINDLPQTLFEEMSSNKNEGFELILTPKFFQQMSSIESLQIVESVMKIIQSSLKRKYDIILNTKCNIIQQLIKGMNRYCNMFIYWDILLQFIKIYPESFNCIQNSKGIMNAIERLLTNNDIEKYSTVVYPHLLPLLDSIHQSWKDNFPSHILSFFTSLFSSSEILTSSSSSFTKSELYFDTYIECTLYIATIPDLSNDIYDNMSVHIYALILLGLNNSEYFQYLINLLRFYSSTKINESIQQTIFTQLKNRMIKDISDNNIKYVSLYSQLFTSVDIDISTTSQLFQDLIKEYIQLLSQSTSSYIQNKKENCQLVVINYFIFCLVFIEKYGLGFIASTYSTPIIFIQQFIISFINYYLQYTIDNNENSKELYQRSTQLIHDYVNNNCKDLSLSILYDNYCKSDISSLSQSSLDVLYLCISTYLKTEPLFEPNQIISSDKYNNITNICDSVLKSQSQYGSLFTETLFELNLCSSDYIDKFTNSLISNIKPLLQKCSNEESEDGIDSLFCYIDLLIKLHSFLHDDDNASSIVLDIILLLPIIKDEEKITQCNEIRKTLLQFPLSNNSNINFPIFTSQLEVLLAKHTAQTAITEYLDSLFTLPSSYLQVIMPHLNISVLQSSFWLNALEKHVSIDNLRNIIKPMCLHICDEECGKSIILYLTNIYILVYIDLIANEEEIFQNVKLSKIYDDYTSSTNEYVRNILTEKPEFIHTIVDELFKLLPSIKNFKSHIIDSYIDVWEQLVTYMIGDSTVLLMKDIVIHTLSELQNSTSDFDPIKYEVLLLIIQHLPQQQADEIHSNILSQIINNIQAKSNIDFFIGLLINISLFTISDETEYYPIFDYLQEQERVIFNESTNPLLYLSIFLLPINNYDSISKYVSLYSNLISNSMNNEITSYNGKLFNRIIEILKVLYNNNNSFYNNDAFISNIIQFLWSNVDRILTEIFNGNYNYTLRQRDVFINTINLLQLLKSKDKLLITRQNFPFDVLTHKLPLDIMRIVLYYFTIMIPMNYKYPEIEVNEDEEISNTYTTKCPIEISEEFIKSLVVTDNNDLYTPYKQWYTLLLLMENMNGETKELLVSFLKQNNIINTMFNLLLQFIPVQEFKSKRKNNNNSKSTQSPLLQTSEYTIMNLNNNNIINYLEYIFCYSVFLLPAVSRDWYESLEDRANKNTIRLYTERYITPLLLQKEIILLKHIPEKDKNLIFQCKTNEVSVEYSKEEETFVFSITLPECYPLLLPTIDPKAFLSSKGSKPLILQILHLLRFRNGSLLSIAQLWKESIDKSFDGLEPCPICYTIVHYANHSLPTRQCATCHNRYHKLCLMKWFESSSNFTCPTCRSRFVL